ncbi:hypothetical protein SmJEL517_g05988 [Synchytrium microbalum]|uniref:AP complex subunit beta n=1 Tax=Synchytrium microbalum TaxID=1806994 RepID=A0A507BRU5_9FUNG|nr:uncharacterized protein SmJEL517_g05988 [Synchytrium microbalum]TPX30432.1 hypothetical protein SmJEL517_g05988 [Synchytrium microbalum]
MAAAPKFFQTNKKGENFELKADLNSEYKEKRKETVKKVIANMTVGKDVSSLFADVVKNMQTEDLELKKLVYLYLINYAKSQPELVILAVNTFVKDSDDPNPLIRALAIRTMGCLRAEKIIAYLMGPLQKALRDDDPYVRKTAAICVAKLFDISPNTAIDNGLITNLQEMLSDRNPMVIANAVAALAEISESSVRKDIFTITSSILTKLLAALNECTEWGQICILTSLASYKPSDGKEAAEIVERVLARLQHANASVVLCAVKVLVVYMSDISDDLQKQVVKKMAPPLVTLLSAEPELQYVALRNINLILQKRPDVLSQEMRVFFTKYNDPPYVKLEKLEVIIKLATDVNIDQVLSELREYANEVDVDFVRKSVRAIGRCAIKIDSASERCVNVLLELIKTKVNYVVQEAIIVMKDVFRKYPHKYEGIIPSLCENLDSLDEPEAKASLIWIIGEYAERIENADELLEGFLENFKEENATVQLQLLTAAVKLFLRKPAMAQDMVHKVLQTATQSVDNPDIRDRAFVYWRLLSTSPQAAKAVVISEKPPIEADTTVSETLLDDLIINIATLASVYHKPSSQFGGTSIQIQTVREDDVEEGGDDLVSPDELGAISGVATSSKKTTIGDLLDLDFGSEQPASPVVNNNISPQGMMGMMSSPPSHNMSAPPPQQQQQSKGGLDDLLGLDSGPSMMPSMGGMQSLGGGMQGLSINPTSNKLSPASGGGMAMFGSSPPFGGANLMGSSVASPAAAVTQPFVPPKVPLLTAATAQGLDLSGAFVRRNGVPYMDLSFANRSPTPLFDFAIQFNVNSFALTNAAPLVVPTISPNGVAEVSLALSATGNVQKMEPVNLLQVAIKDNLGVFYFNAMVPLYALFGEDGASVDTNAFSSQWADVTVPSSSFALGGFAISDVANKLRRGNIFVVGPPSPSIFRAVAKLSNGALVVAEMTMQPTALSVTAKSRAPELLPLFQQTLDVILR